MSLNVMSLLGEQTLGFMSVIQSEVERLQTIRSVLDNH